MPSTITSPELDLSDFAFWRTPVPVRAEAFARLRALPGLPFLAEPEVPGFPVGPGYHAAVRHADVVEVSRRPGDFSSAAGATNVLDLPAEFTEFFGSMISMDNPRHARLRRIVARAFGQRADREVGERVRRAARAAVDDLAAHGGGDFVRLVAARMPVAVICDLLGIPPEDVEYVLERSNLLVGAFDPAIVPDRADAARVLMTAGSELSAYVAELGERRRAAPADDLITRLVTADLDGEHLSTQELASFFVLLVVAGNETTRNAIAHGLVYLTEAPAQRARLTGDLDAVLPTAVEEIVRLASPVIWMRRTVTRDCDLNGHPMTAGDKVLLFYWSANRDERVFADPTAFDVTRAVNPHLGFGSAGPHFCLGARLARLEIATLYRELLTRLPDVHTTSPPRRLESNFVEGVTELRCAL